MMKKKLLSFTAFALYAGMTSAYASKIMIKNDDTAPIDILVEPGEGSIISSTPQIKQVVKPGEELTLNVTKDELGDVKTFSVKGTVKMPSVDNRCSGLFLDEDYDIVFTGTKAGGTKCSSKKRERRSKENPKEAEAGETTEKSNETKR